MREKNKKKNKLKGVIFSLFFFINKNTSRMTVMKIMRSEKNSK